MDPSHPLLTGACGGEGKTYLRLLEHYEGGRRARLALPGQVGEPSLAKLDGSDARPLQSTVTSHSRETVADLERERLVTVALPCDAAGPARKRPGPVRAVGPEWQT